MDEIDDGRDKEPVCKKCQGRGWYWIQNPNGFYATDRIRVDCECEGR